MCWCDSCDSCRSQHTHTHTHTQTVEKTQMMTSMTYLWLFGIALTPNFNWKFSDRQNLFRLSFVGNEKCPPKTTLSHLFIHISIVMDADGPRNINNHFLIRMFWREIRYGPVWNVRDGRWVWTVRCVCVCASMCVSICECMCEWPTPWPGTSGRTYPLNDGFLWIFSFMVRA